MQGSKSLTRTAIYLIVPPEGTFVRVRDALVTITHPPLVFTSSVSLDRLLSFPNRNWDVSSNSVGKQIHHCLKKPFRHNSELTFALIPAGMTLEAMKSKSAKPINQMSDKPCNHHVHGCPYRTSSSEALCGLCKAGKCPHPMAGTQ